ncbi:DUF3034 family protein [Coralloluteibacterium stylophorae]|uniref:DUF3034 family protein n=1 Tax=Coralloluteibacterium stylophorae TaxID=1776034 RepID=A0A8J7VW58_9GAMM|nr:DUF3034 family protein [Coralloluteibacterium stylophorae]MBS7457604.1 DUF3034 family protein [Coralloluteibacterium stylophorae]
MSGFPRAVCALLLLACIALPAQAAGEQGRLLATGGAMQIEGAAGGGIVPWAVLAGYGTGDQNGGSAFHTRIDTGDYALRVTGAAWTLRNRVELSLARQRFALPTLQGLLGLPNGVFEQDVLGAKLRLAGDLVYGDLPQFALGIQHKRQRDFDIPRAVGAVDDSGTDIYLSASRLFLGAAAGRNLLLNATVRATRANQTGLLGFGGDRCDAYAAVFEGSAAVLLNPRWAVGVEYRQKPDNLGFAAENDWRDAFVAWFPNKRVAVIAAWAGLGEIATLGGQDGWYLSIQLSQ